mmetsp:Transcript_56379/g.129056  ORF Transcript_56379/g.129056 Transcript_56379/m.129056 type:complete len:538 (+) Transcript_56379:173-1786(+)
MAPNQHSIGVSVRVRPSASCTHNAEAVELLRGHAWVRNVVGGSDQPASYAALGSELVTRLRGGYSCTLIAYGQTGSGKTYTMFGPSGSLTESALVEAGDGVPAAWGVFPRVALELLRNSEGALHASAVEVYNNVAYDLLDGNRQLQLSAGRQSDVAAVFSGHAEGEGGAATGLNGKHPRACSCRLCFKAQEEAKSARAAKRGSPSPASSLPAAGRKKRAEKEVGSFATVGETLWPIAAPNDVAKLARHVEASRSAHSHKLNDRSSRSHCLLRLHVASGGGRGGGLLVQKQFLFVDLAGSERTQKSGVSGQRLAEATQINNSLTVLGRVIRGLGGGGGGGEHLPYRDSTLTMLLRSSFESDCKAGCFTCVVINVASEPEHAEETACSLQFGERMTAVRNVATLVAGTDVGQERARVAALVETLRSKLRNLEGAGAAGGFVEGARSTERALLTENMEKHRVARQRCELLSVEVAEAVSGSERRANLEKRAAEAHFHEETVAAVMYAQKTIKRLWKEPSASYLATQAELRSVTEQLGRLK